MRILHLIVSLDPAWGGPPTVAARLAAAQSPLVQRVTLAAPLAPGREADVRKSLAPIPQIDKVRVEHLPPALPVFLSAQIRRELDALVADCDLIHIHGAWGSVLMHAAATASRMGEPYIVAPHGMLYPWSLKQKSLKKKLGLMLGYRRMLDEAALIHALNSDEKSAMAPLRLHPPVEILPNGIFMDEIEPLPEKGRFYAAHKELRNRPFILFLSRLHPGKGLNLLAEAFAMVASTHADAQLVVAGPDYGAQDSFVARIRQLDLADRIHLVGPIYGPDKISAMVDAACFCLPSEHETFSMAITEAMGCGLPVVISDACHYSEVAEVDAGIIVPLEPRALADALMKVIETPELARRMGENGRNLVKSRFTWPAIAEQSVRLYERVLGRGGRL